MGIERLCVIPSTSSLLFAQLVLLGGRDREDRGGNRGEQCDSDTGYPPEEFTHAYSSRADF